jgi:hypothetical protein
LFVAAITTKIADPDSQLQHQQCAGSKTCALLRGCAPNFYHQSMFIIPHGAPEGYEWFITLVVLVGLYFTVCNFMRARR